MSHKMMLTALLAASLGNAVDPTWASAQTQPAQTAPAQTTSAQTSSAQTSSAQATPEPALVLTAPTSREATPGSLVTLIFNLRGEGRYTLEVEAPPGWVPVTASRTLDVRGQTLFPVTLRLPGLAPVGQAKVTLHARQNAQDRAAASTTVQVQGHSKVALSSPLRLDATPGTALSIPLEIANLGNRPDTFAVELEGADNRPQISETLVSLAPGERRSLLVSLLLDGVSPDYRFTTYLKATSRLNPAVVARTRTEAVYAGVRRRVGSSALDGPSVTLRVGTGVGAEYQISEDGARLDWRYSLQPAASGQLSDHVEGQVGTDLSGDRARPLPSGISGSLQLRSERWSAQLDGGTGGVGLGGSIDFGAWTVAPRVQYRTLPGGRRYGADVELKGPLAGGFVNTAVGSQFQSVGSQSQRQDSLSARYGRPLGPAFDLSLSAGVQGVQSGAGSYTVGGQVQQVLMYRGKAFDLTQSYGASLGGLQSIGISGGMRAAAPFLVRASVTAQLAPGRQWYEVSGLTLYRSLSGRGVGASLGGRYGFGSAQADSTQAGSSAPLWQVSASVAAPSLSFSSRALGGAVGLDATLQGTLSNNERRPNLIDGSARLDLDLSSASLQASLGAGYLRDAPSALQQRQSLKLSLRSRYKLGLNDLSLGVGAERTSLTDNALDTAQMITQNIYGAQIGWGRQWTKRLSTALDLSQSFRQGSQGNSSLTSAGLGASLSDVFTPGLGVNVGYRISYDTGRATQPITQAARIGLNYEWSLAVPTPQAVVKAFGGLKGSEVKGVLYRDDNLNGQRDPSESVLGGVTVQAGSQTSVTSASGEYRLQVAGSQALTFPKGLSATLEPLGEAPSRQIQGVPGTFLRRDIGFAPVGNVNVLVYNDSNRSGVQEEGETGLPYAPVRLTSLDHPDQSPRLIQADSRGAVNVSLPVGRYSASLDAASLPAGLVAAAPLQAEVQVGGTGGASASAGSASASAGGASALLGVAPLERQAVVSYKSGSAAVLARLDNDTAHPGEAVRLSAQVLGADKLSVRAFGQTYTPSVVAGRAELEFNVPDGTPPGIYELELTATGPDVQKSSGVRLMVSEPEDAAAKP